MHFAVFIIAFYFLKSPYMAELIPETAKSRFKNCKFFILGLAIPSCFLYNIFIKRGRKIDL